MADITGSAIDLLFVGDLDTVRRDRIWVQHVILNVQGEGEEEEGDARKKNLTSHKH